MIEIRNTELFYDTPRLPQNLTGRADVNLVYKTLHVMQDGFTATQMKHMIKEVYGVELSLQRIGHNLKRLTAWGYLENHPVTKGTYSQSMYYRTSRFFQSWGIG